MSVKLMTLPTQSFGCREEERDKTAVFYLECS